MRLQLRFPAKKDAVERFLFTIVWLSPIAVAAHFLYRMATNAYPPDADSIGIPIFFFWIIPFPLIAIMATVGRKGLHGGKLYYLWNPQRIISSIIWTLLSIYPIGLFLLFLFLDALESKFIPSIAYFFFLWLSLLIYRVGIINSPLKAAAHD